MKLRKWQEKVIKEFPDIIKNYRKFILKAPTGAGKTVLASEIINTFYKKKKIVVLCHRLVLLEQLEKGFDSYFVPLEANKNVQNPSVLETVQLSAAALQQDM